MLMTNPAPVEQVGGHPGGVRSLRRLFLMSSKPERCSVSLRTIHDLHDLEALRGIWKSWLGSRDSDLDFFSHHVRSRGAGCEPYIILLCRNDEPEAMLIGLRERRSVPIRVGRITVAQPLAMTLDFVHGGLRGTDSEENCAAIARYLVRMLDQGEADIASWEQLEVDSPMYSALCGLRRPVLRDLFACEDTHWLMNFPPGLDRLWASLRRNQRSKQRRKYRRVLNRFADRVQVREFSSVADLEPAISIVETIASRSDKRRLGFGFFDTAQVRAEMTLAAKAGWLRIYILYLESKPAAFWIGTLYNRCLQADHVAYDQAWAHFSPGTFLLLTILSRLEDEDIQTVDFGRGGTQLKQCFAAVPRAETRVHVYAPTRAGIRLKLWTTAAHQATGLIRQTYCPVWAKTALRKRLAASATR